MEILSGARKHIAHDGTVHWGPFTIVQDLANQRFAIDHRQPYSGGAQGQVEIVVEPQSDGVRGVVRSRDMNLINYNGPLTLCTFNTAPVPPLRRGCRNLSRR